jgi:hypothetical protein
MVKINNIVEGITFYRWKDHAKGKNILFAEGA